MEFFFEKFFEASRASWWQVLAAVCIVAFLAFTVALQESHSVADSAGYAAGGGVAGLIAGVFLLWIDAGQRAREARGENRLTLRERFMIGGLIFGFALGALSLFFAVLMGLMQAVRFLQRL